MAALLFVLTQVGILGNNTGIAQGLLLAAFALILYTPLAYMTDRFVYNRMLRQREKKG
jgi:hypothetical protein